MIKTLNQIMGAVSVPSGWDVDFRHSPDTNAIEVRITRTEVRRSWLAYGQVHEASVNGEAALAGLVRDAVNKLVALEPPP